MPRPRTRRFDFIFHLSIIVFLAACSFQKPLWPGGFDCEEMQGESLRALLGTDASSLDALGSAILVQFPNAVPMLFGRRPLDEKPVPYPLNDFTVQWTTPLREYIAFIENEVIDSIVLTPAANYAGPTAQEVIDCLGAPQEYFAATSPPLLVPQNGLDLRLLYVQTPMAVAASQWGNAMREDGQLVDPANAAEARVSGITYFLPRQYKDWIDRVFWLRESDWKTVTPQEIEGRDDRREYVYAGIRPWPGSWDAIRTRLMN